MNEPAAIPLGEDVIRDYLARLSARPGVYRMLDRDGNALYVGKAKNLRARVSYYAQADALPPRLRTMVSHTAALEIVETENEAQALLLEANLIKRLMPRYNILLRDDKSFPYIFLSGDHEFSRIGKHRGAQTRKGEYFGPYASAGAVNQALAILQRVFLLRPCSDSVFKNRTRPCLQYQIKRCSAPCVGLVSHEDYAAALALARQFLMGQSRQVQDALTAQMQQHSAAMEYEKAAALRDRIQALTQVQQQQALHAPSLKHADVAALYREGDYCCIQLFFFREGQNMGNSCHFPAHVKDMSDADIMEAFLGQIYLSISAPLQVMVSHLPRDKGWVEDALAERAGHKVEIAQPQRGDKFQALEFALRNAREALHRHIAERATQAKLLQGVASLFGLAQPPRRVEVFDNSHIMGTHAVGGMIVATAEGFKKNAYRRFNMDATELAPGDDYAMMRTMLTRRFSRLQKEDSNRQSGEWPDLLLIDGGAGHLSAVSALMEELEIDGVPYVCIAKGVDRNAGRETFFLPAHAPFQLPQNDAVLHYLQRLRDEAHRYAIFSHRNKRSGAIRRSELDAIAGIGSARKKALLHHFGSARAVGTASLDELQRVAGINKKIAELIYNHFHS